MSRIKIYKTDFLIIGSGIAGLRAGLEAGKFMDVTIITKSEVRDTGTGKAQGGIAAALSKKDSPRAHLEDTLAAGAGLCNKKAVEILVRDGVKRVKELIEWGCQFDRGPKGLAFTREAAHRHRRILHVGDATGAEIEKTLGQQILKAPRVAVVENMCALELVVKNNRCFGVLALDVRSGEINFFETPATLLATGGVGQIFKFTTNPAVATGDGLALAWRAGAAVADCEFIQFHPTTLEASHLGEARKSVSVFLISEAVRGEGAILKNIHGERFMLKVHPLAELAPRDVVARAIFEEMKKNRCNFVYLDLGRIPAEYIRHRFPMIYARCLELNLDITKDMIPVSPAAHYFMGGVVTGVDGRTSIKGLYAAGEVANVGVHGANRLASNSLLDGLVFGYRAAAAVKKELERVKASPRWASAREGQGLAPMGLGPRGSRVRLSKVEKLIKKGKNNFFHQKIIKDIKDTMWQKVGIIRDGQDLLEAEKFFRNLVKKIKLNYLSPADFEIANMALVSWLVTRAALTRQESRGAHYRTDFPRTDDRNWRRHLVSCGGNCF